MCTDATDSKWKPSICNTQNNVLRFCGYPIHNLGAPATYILEFVIFSPRNRPIVYYDTHPKKGLHSSIERER